MNERHQPVPAAVIDMQRALGAALVSPDSMLPKGLPESNVQDALSTTETIYDSNGIEKAA